MTDRGDLRQQVGIDGGRRSRGEFVAHCQQWLDENPDASLETRASAALVIATGGDRKGAASWADVARLVGGGATEGEVEHALRGLQQKRGVG